MLEGKVEWIIYYSFVLYTFVHIPYILKISDSWEMQELIFFCEEINNTTKIHSPLLYQTSNIQGYDDRKLKNSIQKYVLRLEYIHCEYFEFFYQYEPSNIDVLNLTF